MKSSLPAGLLFLLLLLSGCGGGNDAEDPSVGTESIDPISYSGETVALHESGGIRFAYEAGTRAGTAINEATAIATFAFLREHGFYDLPVFLDSSKLVVLTFSRSGVPAIKIPAPDTLIAPQEELMLEVERLSRDLTATVFPQADSNAFVEFHFVDPSWSSLSTLSFFPGLEADL